MAANEQVSRVDVVHRWFSEGGDSILSVFSTLRIESLPSGELRSKLGAFRAKLQDN